MILFQLTILGIIKLQCKSYRIENNSKTGYTGEKIEKIAIPIGTHTKRPMTKCPYDKMSHVTCLNHKTSSITEQRVTKRPKQ